MFRLIQILLLTLIVSASMQAQSDTLRFESSDEGDSPEYELIVLDPGYESFLLSQPPMDYFSLFYYENWNARYVREWNYRYLQPLVYGDLFEVYIDYNEFTDYGLELNYRLYYYFRFFENENNIDLLPGKVF